MSKMGTATQELSLILMWVFSCPQPSEEAERFCEVLADAVFLGLELDEEFLEGQVKDLCDADDPDGCFAIQFALHIIRGTWEELRLLRQVTLPDGRIATEDISVVRLDLERNSLDHVRWGARVGAIGGVDAIHQYYRGRVAHMAGVSLLEENFVDLSLMWMRVLAKATWKKAPARKKRRN